MENIIFEISNSQDGHNSRLGNARGKVSELEKIAKEVIQNGSQRKKKRPIKSKQNKWVSKDQYTHTMEY